MTRSIMLTGREVDAAASDAMLPRASREQPMNQKLMTTALAAAASVVMLCLAPPAHGAIFLGLGDLPGGDIYSLANGVSANGSVAVGEVSSTSGFEAFRWTNGGGMVGLGDLSGGSFSSIANGVSADGSVVVGYGNSASGFEAYRWTSGDGMVGLGDLFGGLFGSIANGVSANGAVVVGRGDSSSGPEAFRWTSSGGMVGLGDLPGGSFTSAAFGVSADGAVVVGTSNSTPSVLQTEAFRWTSGGGMVGLGDLSGGSFNSVANGASANGAVIVGRGESSSGAEAFRWTSSGGMVGLGDLPGGGFSSRANGVSANGAVIVGDGFSASGTKAFVWDAANQMRSIADVLAPSVGAALTGWSLDSATAVSADGRIVVGYGIGPNGGNQAWLAYLADDIAWFSQTSGAWDSPTSWNPAFVPGPTDDVVIAPTAALTVSGPLANRTVNTLQLGGSSVGRVALRLDGATGGDLNVVSDAEIFANGELALANGRSFTTPVLYNSGLIRGAGTINADLLNFAGGEVRVAAGETLVISGFGHVNYSKIEVLGSATLGTGEIEFLGPLVNVVSTGLIAGQSAVMRFTGGLTNDGSLALTAGINNVSGDVTNKVGATITVTGGADAVFYDDMVQNGTLRVVKVGSTTSTAVFLGSYSGAGGSTGGGDIFMEGDLRPGNSPASVTFNNNIALGSGATTNIELAGLTAGSQYDQIHVTGDFALDGALNVSLLGGFMPPVGQPFDVLDWGSLSGTFDAINLPALGSGLLWNTSQLYTTGVLSVALAGDYNFDGAVDGFDFLNWQRGDSPNNGSAADLAVWGARFGEVGSATATSTTVPEPATLVLLMFAAAGIRLRRRNGA